MNSYFNIRTVVNDLVLYLIKNILKAEIKRISLFKKLAIRQRDRINLITSNKNNTPDIIKTINPQMLETELFNLNEWVQEADKLVKNILVFLFDFSQSNISDPTEETISRAFDVSFRDLEDKIKRSDIVREQNKQMAENKRNNRKTRFHYNEFQNYLYDLQVDYDKIINNIELLEFNLNDMTRYFNRLKSNINKLKNNSSYKERDLIKLEKMTLNLNLEFKKKFFLIDKNIKRCLANMEFILNEYRKDVRGDD